MNSKSNKALFFPLALADRRSPVIIYPDKLVTVGDLLVSAMQLADRFPKTDHIFNLCRSRHHFMVVFMACLLTKKIMVLPANEAPESLCLLSEKLDNDVVCLVDDALNIDLPTFVFPVDLLSDNAQFINAMPMIDGKQIAVYLLTSGSTGSPSIQVKTWQELVLGARVANHFLPFESNDFCLVSTVPSQHMYGLETSILWVMHNDCSVWNDKPFYPSDVQQTLEHISQSKILVSTPYHLNNMVASSCVMPKVDYVVCATAPLSRASAEGIERYFSTKVKEVYGSSETGMIATRETASSDYWQLLNSIKLSVTTDGALVSGGHLLSPVMITDALEAMNEIEFRFLGRNADLIKVAGKRTSINYLNQLVMQIDGVSDACFFMPDNGYEEQKIMRLCLFVVSSNHSKSILISQLKQKIDAVFLPRPIIFVEKLPRNETGKLPRLALEQLFYRYTETQHE
ncbi:MAG: AMP-binding protein [Thiotrichales bacterium]|jgi:acyl-coenzyme A synthetase/AMP-(fatty) acid ligase|nr:AMP-binding protein [Thiotrichales bacterium]